MSCIEGILGQILQLNYLMHAMCGGGEQHMLILIR